MLYDQEQGDQIDPVGECKARIDALEQRVAAIEQKVGIQSQEADPLKEAIAATRPFGAGQ
jgi:hypothetical protein